MISVQSAVDFSFRQRRLTWLLDRLISERNTRCLSYRHTHISIQFFWPRLNTEALGEPVVVISTAAIHFTLVAAAATAAGIQFHALMMRFNDVPNSTASSRFGLDKWKRCVESMGFNGNPSWDFPRISEWRCCEFGSESFLLVHNIDTVDARVLT